MKKLTVPLIRLLANVNVEDGVTGEDALYIQKYLRKLISELPIPVIG